MKSEFFKDFGIPDADCEIEASFHPQFRIPYLFFRSTGNPLVGLDMTGASQLQQRLARSRRPRRSRTTSRKLDGCKTSHCGAAPPWGRIIHES